MNSATRQPPFDELSGQPLPKDAPAPVPAAAGPSWRAFWAASPFDAAALDRQHARLLSQMADNGLTYRLGSSGSGHDRPWSTDLLPVLLSRQEWSEIAAGVRQRVRLLDAVAADVYGAQRLLALGLLPPALVHGHPGFLRGMRGASPRPGRWLHVAAFDLARAADGAWWVVSQRTQAPSGLGFLLENRQLIARLFPQAFEALGTQQIGEAIEGFAQALGGDGAREGQVAVLTPGPEADTYLEDAYLARLLGLAIVEAEDLTVRGTRVFLKTLRGLEPISTLLRRVDDDELDPLESPACRRGVPGLLHAVREGGVTVANAPGTSFLESPGLLGFLPRMAETLLEQPLLLPAWPTWWCGETAVLDRALDGLAHSVVKATYPAERALLAQDATRLPYVERSALAATIRARGEHYTLQRWLDLPRTPQWRPGQTEPGHLERRPFMLRVFAVAQGPDQWQVIPGGLARLVGPDHKLSAMQRGGSSADVWIMGSEGMHGTAPEPTPAARRGRRPTADTERRVTSRAAESLFWLGRYTERADNALRSARQILDAVRDEARLPPALRAWIGALARYNALVGADTPDPGPPESSPLAASRFERALLAALANPAGSTGAALPLQRLVDTATTLGERLSPEQLHLIRQALAGFVHDARGQDEGRDRSAAQALHALAGASRAVAAITGAQGDRMTRDAGWHLLNAGRGIERLAFGAQVLQASLDSGALNVAGLEAAPIAHDHAESFDMLLALFDCTITYRAEFQQSRDVGDLLATLVHATDVPRALAAVIHELADDLARLPHQNADGPHPLLASLPAPALWPTDPQGLRTITQACEQAAADLSTQLSARYFNHTQAQQAVGN